MSAGGDELQSEGSEENKRVVFKEMRMSGEYGVESERMRDELRSE